MISKISFSVIGIALLIRFSIPPTELTGDVTVLKLDLKPIQSQLASITESKMRTAVLQLEDVVAERQPGTFWEVYVGAPAAKRGPESPSFVGNVALYGSGIRGETQREFKPAHFTFPLNRALRAARKTMKNGELVVTFVPRGSDANGGAAHPRPLASVRIGRISIGVDAPGR